MSLPACYKNRTTIQFHFSPAVFVLFLSCILLLQVLQHPPQNIITFCLIDLSFKYSCAPLTCIFTFHGFSYLRSAWYENIEWKIPMINNLCVKLRTILSGALKSCAVALRPTLEGNHPFVQRLHAVDAPCAVVTEYSSPSSDG